MKEIRCNTGEVVYTYEDYLKTKHWNNIKEMYKRQYKYVCTMCDETKGLHLHHMTYKNIGREKFTDLVYLCKTCHHKIHKTLDAEKSKALGSLAEKLSKKKKKIKVDCKKCFHYNADKDACMFFKYLSPNRSQCKNFYPQLKDTGFKYPKNNTQKIFAKQRKSLKPTNTSAFEIFAQSYELSKTKDDFIRVYQNNSPENAYYVSKGYRFYVLQINPLLIEVRKNKVVKERCEIIEKTHAK